MSSNSAEIQSEKNPPNGLFYSILGQHPYIPFSPQKPRNAPSVNLNFTNNPSVSTILQSCNGLFLCGNKRSRTFYVYNPTTNRSTLLPEFRRGFPCGKTLAFDPVKSPYYKVVFVRYIVFDQFVRGLTYQIEIYSSEIGGWRIGGVMKSGKLQIDKGVYWNGSIHWLSTGLVGNSWRFHVDSQVFDEMPTPPVQLSSYWRGDNYFLESFDHLHFIEPGTQFNVYEMRRDYSEWFVKYCVDLSPVITAYGVPRGRHQYIFTKLALIRDEKDSILVLRIPEKVLKYDLVDGSFEKLIEFEDYEVNGILRYLDAEGFQYIESLCCV
ncbi:hypothetical protein RD792_005181 [Penstemon davidsonii]|uniref:F-box associated beta-propeller type 1 domain-containing protein n=1 Tax=Penstemon davidsonii TaxID=160366 RepID=A0ABR0DJH1_9LAMI|nr:hypothetical protein RD792_005181 [Penstemon davidsonii]